MVRKNLLIVFVVFAISLFGCDGKGSSSVSISENSTTPNTPQETLKSADTILKSIRSVSITDENDTHSKMLVLNLIGYTEKLDFKALAEFASLDKALEVSALAQKVKVKLKKM